MVTHTPPLDFKALFAPQRRLVSRCSAKSCARQHGELTHVMPRGLHHSSVASVISRPPNLEEPTLLLVTPVNSKKLLSESASLTPVNFVFVQTGCNNAKLSSPSESVSETVGWGSPQERILGGDVKICARTSESLSSQLGLLPLHRIFVLNCKKSAAVWKVPNASSKEEHIEPTAMNGTAMSKGHSKKTPHELQFQPIDENTWCACKCVPTYTTPTSQAHAPLKTMSAKATWFFAAMQLPTIIQ
mmetsp:Transcript_10777/g.26783  ORF Transcript_10777/g.26783 Transcript_10777/m.26783 type:complete len:244 (+) Transcript_10777:74-805(+)